jgi:hypothetical protein
MSVPPYPESVAPDPDRSAPPRVVHLVPALFGGDGTVGGAERYALELALEPSRLRSY